MMPDSSGKVKGISVPAVPWRRDSDASRAESMPNVEHAQTANYWPSSQLAQELEKQRERNAALRARIEALHRTELPLYDRLGD